MPTDQEPRTMSAERLQELRSETWEPTHDELLKELDAQMAAHAETLNERDAARWERDRAISQWAATREQLEQLAQELAGDGTPLQIAIQRRQMWMQECDQRKGLAKQLAETLGIARELGEALEPFAECNRGWVEEGKRAEIRFDWLQHAQDAFAKARAAGILNAPDALPPAKSGEDDTVPSKGEGQ